MTLRYSVGFGTKDTVRIPHVKMQILVHGPDRIDLSTLQIHRLSYVLDHRRRGQLTGDNTILIKNPAMRCYIITRMRGPKIASQGICWMEPFNDH